MIAFKYSKTDGAEYLSHLDLLRHIYRTMRRAGVAVGMSGGYHSHARIFLNNPLPTGIKSVAEYCAAEAVCDGDFEELFNRFSPAGVKCLAYMATDVNPNYANGIYACKYFARGLFCDPAEILGKSEIILTDTRGREVDIRPRIRELSCDGKGCYFTVNSGVNNLRADLFCSYISSVCGGKAEEIIKVAAYGNLTF